MDALMGQDELVVKFVASIPPFDPARGFGPCTAVGWVDRGKLIGGTVFHNYEPEAGVVELTTATTSPRWLTRKSLRLIFEYPFNVLGCQLVVLRVSERNTRMRVIAKRFGFDEFVIPRLRGKDEAECVYTLTVERWRSHRLTRH